MAETDLEDIRRMLEDLIHLLPGAVANELLTEARLGQLGANERVQVLREALATYLSERRPDKLRRAFTKPLEPYLVDEDWLVSSAQDVPGLISRLDAGTLWTTAALNAAGSQDAEQMARLGERALDDGFFETNEKLITREATNFVLRQLERAAADSETFYRWLQTFNTNRISTLEALGRPSNQLRPRTREWLKWVQELLQAGGLVSRHFANLRSQIRSVEPLTAKRGVELMQAIKAALDIDLAKEGLDPALADLVPAVALNLSLAYEAVGDYAKRNAGTGQGIMAGQAVAAHIFALTFAIDRTLSEVQDEDTERRRTIFVDLLEQAVVGFRAAQISDTAPGGALIRLALRAKTNPAFEGLAQRLAAL